jgi:hypothetical protein
MGQYSDIVEIVTLSSAVAGSVVNVEVRIKNLCSYAINLTATKGRIDGTVLRFGSVHRVVNAGQTASWYDSFNMPDDDVVVSVESWYEGSDGIWRSDDYAEKQISLYSVPASEFGSISITSYERR